MVFGKTTIGGSDSYFSNAYPPTGPPFEFYGRKCGTLFETPIGGDTVNIIMAYLRNATGTFSEPIIQFIIYDEADNIIAVTESKKLNPGEPDIIPTWHGLGIIDPNTGVPYTPGVGIFLPQGKYRLTLHICGSGGVYWNMDYTGAQKPTKDFWDNCVDGPADPFENGCIPVVSPDGTYSRAYSIYASMGGEAQPPKAIFTVSLPAQVNEPVDFDATASMPGWTGSEISPISSWAWDFGDGITDSGETVQHIYTAEGFYPVTLTVTDSQGLTDSITQTIWVGGELTEFHVGFEQIDPDFKVGNVCRVDGPPLRDTCSINAGPFIYWHHGGSGLNIRCLEMEFVPTSPGEPVHSGAQAARLSNCMIPPDENPLDQWEANRRVEILHQLNPLLVEHVWQETWFFIPTTFKWTDDRFTDPEYGGPAAMWFSFYRMIYERRYLPGASGFNINIGPVWRRAGESYAGRIVTEARPEFFVSNTSGAYVDKSIQNKVEEYLYFSDDDPIPIGRMFRIKTHVFRNLADWEKGYLELWITDPDAPGGPREIYRKYDPLRTIGLDPAQLASYPCHGPAPYSHLCAGFGIYSGWRSMGDCRNYSTFGNTIFVDDFDYKSTAGVTYTITIASAGNGTTSPEPGDYSAPEGSLITVTALANDGYKFNHWELDGETITDNPFERTSSPDINGKTLTAYFVEETIPPDKWKVTIVSTEGGITEPFGEVLVDEEYGLQVTAIPDEEYMLDHWEFDGTDYGKDNPITIPTQPVNTTHTLLALFTPKPPPISLAKIAAIGLAATAAAGGGLYLIKGKEVVK